MGGRQKRLTQTRRKQLQKEMTEALIAGTFRLGEGQSLDTVLDEIDDGIKNDRYPIEVDLPSLLQIWSGAPAPAEAQTAAGVEQGAAPAADPAWGEAPPPPAGGGQHPLPGPPEANADLLAAQAVVDVGGTQMDVMQAAMGPAAVPGTVEHAQAQAAGMSPIAHAVLGTGPSVSGHPAWSSAQQAVVPLNPDGSAADPLPGPAAAPAPPMNGTPAPVVPAAVTTEIGMLATTEPEKKEEKPSVPVDLDAVRGWLDIARQAKAKMAKQKDVLDQAMAQVNDFLDLQGGPDISKRGLLDGQQVVRRTFIERKDFKKEALKAAHPEIDLGNYTEVTPYYKSEILS